MTTTATAMERVAFIGLPCAVRQADKVCAQDKVTALIENILTRAISVLPSASLSEG